MKNKSSDEVRCFGVSIRLKRTPATVAIEFPDDDLADAYLQNIQAKKQSSRRKGSTVKMNLPSSATEIDMSRTLTAIVVHVDDKDDAAEWTDDICRPVTGRRRQVYIKQYWSEEDFEELKKNLKTNPKSKPKRQGGQGDRAAGPPRPAFTSLEAEEDGWM